MNNFFEAHIKNLIVHSVGNKTQEQPIILSDFCVPLDSPIANDYLKSYFFSSFKFEESYHFHHSSDVELNEIYHFTKQLFDSQETFVDISKNMAQHLYDVADHPNIKSGELYVAYIENATIDNIKTNIVGIFKGEKKDNYINVANEEAYFNLNYFQGTNITKLDKGCLICDMGQKIPTKVFMLDKATNDAQYWKEQFLNLKIDNNDFHLTTTLLDNCQYFIEDINHQLPAKEKLTLLDQSANYFQHHQNFEIEDFVEQVFEDEQLGAQFKSYITQQTDVVIPDQFDIADKAVKKAKKHFKKQIVLDNSIEIKIKREITSNTERIEQGYDEQKGLRYYKIYYDLED